MNEPLVSILVPIFRVEEYIERCARSIFNQTYSNLEFVFVDDASPDKSAEMLQQVITDYPKWTDRITIIHHEKNLRLASTRNTLVDNSNGDFLFWVDSDDWVEPNAVEVLVKRQQETNADIVYTIGYYYHAKESQKRNFHGWTTDKETLLKNVLQCNATISLWSKLIRKSLFINNSLTCDKLSSCFEDFTVLPQLIYYSQTIACVDAFIYHYDRSNTNSYVANRPKNIEYQRQTLLAIKAVCVFFQNKEPHYHSLVKQTYLRYNYIMLNYNFRSRNKIGYNEFLKQLVQSERKDWHLIGWDRPLKRIVDRNYHLRRLASFIKRKVFMYSNPTNNE